MSTRWYPIYQKGNPQLRIFLPNFWLKLIRPVHEQPPNRVQFSCALEMTQHDVKNYLEKIYNVPVISVRTRVEMGKTRRDSGRGYVVKADDVKLAYVTLPTNVKFDFPEVCVKQDVTKQKSDNKAMEEMKQGFKKYLDKNKNRPSLPGWFSI